MAGLPRLIPRPAVVSPPINTRGLGISDRAAHGPPPSGGWPVAGHAAQAVRTMGGGLTSTSAVTRLPGHGGPAHHVDQRWGRGTMTEHTTTEPARSAETVP